MDDVSAFLSQLRRITHEETEKLARLRELEMELDRDLLYADHLRKQMERIRKELEACRGDMEHLVSVLLRIPPWHSRHRRALLEFNREASFESSVFVMTKFP